MSSTTVSSDWKLKKADCTNRATRERRRYKEEEIQQCSDVLVGAHRASAVVMVGRSNRSIAESEAGWILSGPPCREHQPSGRRVHRLSRCTYHEQHGGGTRRAKPILVRSSSSCVGRGRVGRRRSRWAGLTGLQLGVA